MKTKLILFSLLLTTYCLLSPAQVPQGFNYQAIATDAGLPVTALIDVRISIQSDSITPVTTFWVEEHYLVQPNESGLFTLIIGKGTRISGDAIKFSDIDWSVTPKFILTEINHNGWKTMGSSRLWSVPYSMVAGDIGGTIDKLRVKGKETSPDSVLFEVKNSNGQTVFAVYSEGVRIYVDDGIAKSGKGGFAIGGFGMDKGVSQKYLIVKPDSIRMYIDDRPGKSSKGGFAIGGFGTGKYPAKHLLIVNPDSIRAYIDTTNLGKSAKGGFAIGGFGTAKGITSKYLSVYSNKTDVLVNDPTKGFTVSSFQAGITKNFMQITPLNNFIGEESGKMIAPAGDNGKYNSFMGFQSGKNTTTGSKNVIIGYQAGLSCNSSFNILIGNEAGKINTGDYNLFIGHGSGILNQGGNGNMFLGFNSGGANTSGYNNLFLGVNTGSTNSTGHDNVFVGNSSGGYNDIGIKNTCVGIESGLSLGGDGNVMIGYQAGYNEAGSNRLYIDNTSTNSPLIWGDFLNRRLVINGKASNNTLNRTFFVNGSAGGTGAWWNDSDIRFKKDINTIPDALNKVMKLHGVNFYWKDETDRDTGKQMGFIAQEVKEVIPEVVSSEGETLSMQYAPVTALLVEAMKEQQSLIDNQKAAIEQLKSENEKLHTAQLEILKQVELIKNQLSEKK